MLPQCQQHQRKNVKNKNASESNSRFKGSLNFLVFVFSIFSLQRNQTIWICNNKMCSVFCWVISSCFVKCDLFFCRIIQTSLDLCRFSAVGWTKYLNIWNALNIFWHLLTAWFMIIVVSITFFSISHSSMKNKTRETRESTAALWLTS